MNNNALLRLQVRIQTAWMNLRDSERGQAVVEYVGIAFVVVAVIGVVVKALADNTQIGTSLIGKIVNAINNTENAGKK
jgi:hypothetical protein